MIVLKAIITFTVLVLFGLPACHAQPPVPPPKKIWVSLGHSTLDVRPPDWKWLRAQCAGGRALKVLSSAKQQTAAIVVPVFDDGRCFYQTSVAPFTNRNPQASADEAALRSLLAAAKKAKVAVYLGIDVLGWQKTSLDKKAAGIFGQYPQLQELNREGEGAARPEARYASPFNPQVRAIMAALLREIGTKFPEASGVVLDVRLSGGEITGYSEAARAASILDQSLDPIDLNISSAANTVIDKPVRQWIEWRRGVLLGFVKSLGQTYRSANHGSKVLCSGYADYYAQVSFNDYRSAQDWRGWSNAGIVDGVLLEGRWLSRYHDAEYFQTFATQTREPKLAASGFLIAASSGSGLIKDSDYQRDWNALKSRHDSIEQVALIARGDDDLHRIAALASGSIVLSQVALPKVGEIAPTWTLQDAAGALRDSKAWTGQSAMLWLLLGRPTSADQALLQAFGNTAPRWRHDAIEPIVISFASIAPPLTQSPAHEELSTPPLKLIDRAGELMAPFGSRPTLLAIDRAGFIRRIEAATADGLERLVPTTNELQPMLQIGQTAPDFAIGDMNGRPVRLSDFRGRRHVLLTFFPKCFTGGCQNHLSSLRDRQADLEKAGVEVFAVSVDPSDVQIAFAERWNLPFSLIPDTGRNVSLLFGAAQNPEQLSDRQSVFIDKSGVVRFIDRQVNVQTHGADVLQKIQELHLVS